MKRYLLKFTLFALIQVGIGTWVCVNYPLKYDPYLEGGPRKEAWLKKAASPRMVFIGGSGLAFGINSKRVAHSLGYHPVNMGLHGGLGISFMINQVSPHLRPGDVVVCSFEHSLLTEENTRGLIKFVLERKPETILRYSWAEWRVLTDTALDYLGGVFKTTIKTFGKEVNPPARSNPQQTFMPWGDFVGHRHLPRRGVPPPGRALRLDPLYQARIMKQVNRFYEECRAKDVLVYFTYSPFAPSHHEPGKETVRQMDAYLRENLKIPMLDSPEELVYDEELFFDAKHHLTWKGITPRTDHVIERLRPALEKAGRLYDPL